MKVCVLQPCYEGSDSDYQHYDPARDLTALLPDCTMHHAFLKKATTFRQLQELKRQGFDIYVNLCEGSPLQDIPGLDVILALEQLNLPYTGPTASLYDPPKDVMKLVAAAAGVPTADYVLAGEPADVEQALKQLRFPLFVKPNAAGDSVSIDTDARVQTPEQLRGVAGRILAHHDQALIEEYVDGREFTVLVATNPNAPNEPIAYLPLEFLFPPGECFKTYDLKVKRYLPECNRSCLDPVLAAALRTMACDIFRAFSGVGYARLDFRQGKDGRLYFLEINFTCSVFYPEGSYGSADYILRYDGIGQTGFLRHILGEGLARHRRRQKKYRVARSPVAGYGIVATVDLEAGEVIFEGEGQPHRLVTRTHVDATWDNRSRQVFRQYAFPLSEDVSILWPEEPAAWAPQNHACDPNTEYRGLNVYARRRIRRGEELTLDYSTFCGEEMEQFACRCGAHCRGWVRGSAASTREASSTLPR